LLPDGILVRKDLFCEAIAEDDVARIGRNILGSPNGLVIFIEDSSAKELEADSSEIAGRNNAPSRPGRLPGGLRRVDAHSRIATFDWALIHGSGCQNLWICI